MVQPEPEPEPEPELGLRVQQLHVLSESQDPSVFRPLAERIDDWMRNGERSEGTWTGGTIWKSSTALSALLRALPAANWRGTSVLELGCGCALSGLTAAALGAERVLLTDRVLHMAEHNRDLNFPAAADQQRVPLAHLRWGDAGDISAIKHFKFDLVLGSDILYHLPAYKALAQTLHAVCDTSTVVLLCTPNGRNPDEDQFFEEMRRVGFRCAFTLHDWKLLPVYARYYRAEFPCLTKWMVSDEIMDPVSPPHPLPQQHSRPSYPVPAPEI